MIKPVETRWNSKSNMLARAVYLQGPIEDLCSTPSLQQKFNTGQYALTGDEWIIIKQLMPLLDVRTP